MRADDLLIFFSFSLDVPSIVIPDDYHDDDDDNYILNNMKINLSFFRIQYFIKKFWMKAKYKRGISARYIIHTD